MKSQTRNRLLLLLLLASLSGLLYLMPMEYPLTGFIMKLRSQKLLAYLLVAIAGGLATISFQTITENRFFNTKHSWNGISLCLYADDLSFLC